MTLPLPSNGRRTRVLVVDDEPLVGRAVRRVLSEQAEVLSVTAGQEALDLLADPAQQVDVILCDLMMPDMNGPEFRTALEKLRPDLDRTLVFITGGAYTPEMEDFLATSGCRQLLKPFDVNALRSTIEELAAS